MQTGDEMPLKLKLDEAGHVVVTDGKPVYVNDDGKEIAYDANQASDKIRSLCDESKKHREAAQEAQEKLKAFDGISDPAEAIKAIEICKNLDNKKLIDAGEMERVKAEITKAANAKTEEAEARYKDLEARYNESMIGNSFNGSKYVKEKLTIPSDIAKAVFSQSFYVNDKGEVIAKDGSGNDIYSQINPGSVASFDEALEMLVGRYPNKDSILRSNQASGGGTNSVNAGGRPLPASFAECKTEEERRLFIQSKAASK